MRGVCGINARSVFQLRAGTILNPIAAAAHPVAAANQQLGRCAVARPALSGSPTPFTNFCAGQQRWDSPNRGRKAVDFLSVAKFIAGEAASMICPGSLLCVGAAFRMDRHESREGW
jgi:hypothetical protein